MTFLWPGMLWMALLLPVLGILYAWVSRRRREAVLRYSGLASARQALGPGGAWRRHIPAGLVLCALAALIMAGARPMAAVSLPRQQQTVILTMDVSASMGATDVLPSRLGASQAAAKRFVQDLPVGVKVGVVTYSGSATLVQVPTRRREDVLTAIDRFQVQRSTAIGSGILVALGTIFPEASSLLAADATRNRHGGIAPEALGLPDSQDSPPVAPGSFESAVIVLLSDGENNAGPAPMEAAQLAARRGVKVFTVGFGSKAGGIVSYEGWSMRVHLDEDTMKRIADITRGEYFSASSNADLKAVYQTLKTRLAIETALTEITVLFAYLSGLLMVTATALSLWWFGRLA